jgi:FkbM family methyltransferase
MKKTDKSTKITEQKYSPDDFRPCFKNTDLTLDFSVPQELNIAKEIFIERAYSNFFPFYEKGVILDVGAHFGYFSLFASVNAPKSKIISLEPSSDNFNVLEKNIKINKISNIQAFNLGVSDKTGETSLFISKSKNHSIFDSSKNRLSSCKKEEIKVISLEDLLKKSNVSNVDFMKMDCEGSEYPLLFNTTKNTFKKIKTISLEFHDVKDEHYTGLRLRNFLKKQGYNIVKFDYNVTHKNINYGRMIATFF